MTSLPIWSTINYIWKGTWFSMSKPKSVPVPAAEQPVRHREAEGRQGIQEPLSGSKKVKTANHVSHNNPEG
ncbi:hypothetical protein J27TS7_52130 [Paenibacillus dendritiformis]|nr:hypothetical protein J27TS7_52130 [Paenibacillus dendritiformis]